MKVLIVNEKYPPYISGGAERFVQILAEELPTGRPVPSIYFIAPPNDGLALRHRHHFEPVDFVFDHGPVVTMLIPPARGQRTYARACGCRQRPRRH